MQNSEQARIPGMIKAGMSMWLRLTWTSLRIGLIDDQERRSKIEPYLSSRKPGMRATHGCSRSSWDLCRIRLLRSPVSIRTTSFSLLPTQSVKVCIFSIHHAEA